MTTSEESLLSAMSACVVTPFEHFSDSTHAAHTKGHATPYIPTSRDSSAESDFAKIVDIPDYYAEEPEAWFHSINATFAVHGVTNSLTKFHWAVSKLPLTMAAIIGPLCKNLSAVDDPYAELQRKVLLSYGLSDYQRTVKWLDHPDLVVGSNNRPSVLWDQLDALQPDSIEEVQKVLFLRKLPAYIRDRVNPGGFEDLHALVQWCDYIWANRSQDDVPRSHSPSRGSRHRHSLPFRGKRPGNAKSGHWAKH
jgi:hypothetical protein